MIKLNLNDVAILNQELHLMQTEKDISFVTKYQLSKLQEKTTKIVKNYNDSRNAIIKKYGSLKEGSKVEYELAGSKDEVKATKEITALIEVIEEFNEKYPIEDFKDLKSTNTYNKLMLFLTE